MGLVLDSSEQLPPCVQASWTTKRSNLAQPVCSVRIGMASEGTGWFRPPSRATPAGRRLTYAEVTGQR